MTADDHVDALHRLGQGQIAVVAQVAEDDNQVCLSVQFGQVLAHGLLCPTEGQSGYILGLVDDRRIGVGQPQDTHPGAPCLDDGVGLHRIPGLAGFGVEQVGRQDWAICLGNARPQYLLAPIELVVAQRPGIVSGDVHGGHDYLTLRAV